MPRNTAPEIKKKDLLARKEKLIEEIKYYEERIKNFPIISSKLYFDGNASSDSDEDCTIKLDVGPSMSELKTQDNLLKTCLKATQELTSLSILQTHHSIMVENPVIDGVMVVSEPGMWSEVAAECYIDLVSFSITFYTHQPSRKFAAASFRGLRVLPVKRLQEAELSHHSLLASATCPSDAVDVIRSYAVAYRSRRTTMHRLAKMFTRHLFMEPLADGGFITKLSNLLQISWHLENHNSTVAPFHHKMKFQIEYVEESYLKIIKQLYKQLANPSLETDERTLLLSKLISTCCEAHPNLDSESDLEPDRTNANDHPQDIVRTDRHDNADDQVMAPPKAIPKKAKPKGKENAGDNRKSTKRSAGHDGEIDNGKKAKIYGNSGKTVDANENTVGKKGKTNSNVIDVDKTDKTGDKKADTNGVGRNELADDNVKNDVDENTNEIRNYVKSVSDIVQSKEDKLTNPKNKVIQLKNAEKKVQKHDENVDRVDNIQNSDVQNFDKEANKINIQKKKKIDDKNVEDTQKQTKNENAAVEKNNQNSEKVKNKAIFKKTAIKEIKGAQDKVKNMKDADLAKKQVNNNKTEKNKLESCKETKKNADYLNIKAKNDEADEGNKNSTGVTENIVNKAANSKPKNIDQNKDKENVKSTHPKNFEATKQKTANVKIIQNKGTAKKDNNKAIVTKSDNLKEKAVEKSVNVLTNNKKITDADMPTDSHTKNKENITNAKTVENNSNTIKKYIDHPSKNKDAPPKNENNLLKHKMSIKNHRNTKGKVIKTLSAHKNLSKDSGVSKIPQKKLSPAYAAALQQMPVRMSPRMTTKFKSVSDSNLQAKIVKPASKLPRLLKPAPKSK